MRSSLVLRAKIRDVNVLRGDNHTSSRRVNVRSTNSYKHDSCKATPIRRKGSVKTLKNKKIFFFHYLKSDNINFDLTEKSVYNNSNRYLQRFLGKIKVNALTGK